MTMFLIQALLWLLVAFLLGYGIGRFLKPLFCREEVDRDVYGMNMLHTDTGSGEAPRSAVSATTAAVLGGGATVAAGAGLAAKAASAFDFSRIDPHKPIIDPPDLDIEFPEVSLEAPQVDVDLPEAEAYLDIPQVGTDMLDAEKQALDVELEKVETEVRSLEAELLEATEATGVDLEMPMDAPDVSLASATEAETDSSLSGAAAAAIAAGGAALIANTASATEGDEGDASQADDWLLKLVQQAKDAYHGRNPRAVSKLLLHTGSDYDCSAIDQYESLTLQPATYDKLGFSHCGVPRAGFVAVGGDVSNVEQGAAVLFHACNIVVCRDAEDNHYFIRVAG